MVVGLYSRNRRETLPSKTDISKSINSNKKTGSNKNSIICRLILFRPFLLGA